MKTIMLDWIKTKLFSWAVVPGIIRNEDIEVEYLDNEIVTLELDLTEE